jgi:putative flippase GtrA
MKMRLNSLLQRLPGHQHLSPELLRYLSVAAVIVGAEVVSFQLMVWTGLFYLIATPASMLIGIVLNWWVSRAFVFKHRPHKVHKEFILVFIASIIGIGLQTAVTAAVVQFGHGAPLAGKLLAICVTFFWNFWFRKKYVFYDPNRRT